MKICHCSSYLPYYHNFWGGAEQAALRLARAQVQDGHEVFVLTTKPNNMVVDNFTVCVVETIESYLPWLARFIDRVKRWLPFDIIAFIRTYILLKRIKPDVMHIHNVKALSLAVVLAGKLCGLRVVFSIYDYWLFCPSETLGGHKIWPLVLLRSKIFKPFINLVDCFLVLSNSSAEILQRFGVAAKRILIIHLSFDINRFEAYGLRQMIKGRILYVGWLQPRKGLHIVLEALPQVLQQHKNASLHVIGAIENAEYHAKIEQVIECSQLGAIVQILGKVDDVCLQDEIKKANVIVIPEQWPNMSPLFLLEAMSYAKPVVASRIGGLPEFIIDGVNGFLFPPESAADLAKKIDLMLADQAGAEQMGIRARNAIADLCDETKNRKTIEHIYKV